MLIALFVKTFLTLLVVMDPPGLAPIFMGLAGERAASERRAIALKATLVATGIIFSFAFFGQRLLENIGISISAFRVAGGLLLFLIALDMVFARTSGAKETPQEEAEAHQRPDISVFPIAIPLIAGPGTLTSVMILTGSHRHDLTEFGVVLLVIVLLLGLCYLSLRLASNISELIGVTGVNVVTRVLGVLLAALAVQYVADGVKGLMQTEAASKASVHKSDVSRANVSI